MAVSRRSILAGAAGMGGAVAALGRPGVAGAQQPAADVTAVTGVTVIDADGARRDQTVLIKGNRILDAGSLRRVPVPHGARVIDGRGRFLVPGLVDMHTHAVGIDPFDPDLYVVNGVTTTREMSRSGPALVHREEIRAGRIGPQWAVGSLILDGTPSLWEGSSVGHIAVADAAQARRAVRDQVAAGAEFIKTYSRLSRESLHAIAAESRRQGVPFLGHVPDFVETAEASDAGLHSLEHLFEIWYDTSRDEDRIRREIARVRIDGGDYAGWFTKLHPLELAAARSYDRGKAARVFERLARNGTHVTPTLSVHWTCDLPQDVPHDDPRFRYAGADLQGYWQWSNDNVFLKGRSAQESIERRELFERRLHLAGDLARTGVPVLAGTDLGTAYLLPGFSLHDELRWLVRAGLTPLQALRAATLEPARSLRRHDQGTVARGKAADLVLLDADPLRDIANTTRINSVFVRGHLIDPAARRRILADIETGVRATTPTGVIPAAAACPCHGAQVPALQQPAA